MEDTNWICTLVNKLNVNIFIFSCLVALLVYVLIGIELIWAIIILFACYLLTLGIIKRINIYLIKRENRKYIKERNRKIAQEEQEKIMAFNTIFESLSDEYKRTLIELYSLKNPDGSCINERILQNDSNLKMKVSNICNQLNNTFFGIDLIHERNSIGTTIVLIEKEFYLVLEKKSKTFVM